MQPTIKHPYFRVIIDLAAAGFLLAAAATLVAAGAPGVSTNALDPSKYDANGHKIVNETHYKEISVPEAQKYLADHPDALLLDLRTPREYSRGHILNATNYSVQNDATYQQILGTLDPSRWYLVHSAVGHWRTVRALEYFEAHNFEHVAAIDGGYQAWTNAGLPVIKPPASTTSTSRTNSPVTSN